MKTDKNKLITIEKLRSVIFSSLGYDDFNLIRSNKLYDRILFDYGYYGSGVTVKRVKGCIFHYNYVCGLNNNKFQESENYKYRINANEINLIIKLLKEI